MPLYHPDARAWEVTRGGRHMAVFIGDYFARGSKRSGAWCSAIRSQRKLGGDVRPVVVNVCNFAKGDPALLSYDDARTLFHEFGHALHQMLSDVTYGSSRAPLWRAISWNCPASFTSTGWKCRRCSRTTPATCETGAPMPAGHARPAAGGATYDQGFATVEYVASALVDLAFHEGTPPADPVAREAEVLAGLGMPRAIRMRHATRISRMSSRATAIRRAITATCGPR